MNSSSSSQLAELEIEVHSERRPRVAYVRTMAYHICSGVECVEIFLCGNSHNRKYSLVVRSSFVSIFVFIFCGRFNNSWLWKKGGGECTVLVVVRSTTLTVRKRYALYLFSVRFNKGNKLTLLCCFKIFMAIICRFLVFPPGPLE